MTPDPSRLARDYARVWDADAPGDLVDRLFGADVVDHNPQPEQGQGREGVRGVIDLYHAVFPDLRVTVDDVVAAGDRVVVRWTAHGTHEGGQLGVPATHREVTMTGIDILRLQDGLIAERWAEANALEMMQQLTPA